jgi:polyisoprenoid-binding protein YceI
MTRFVVWLVIVFGATACAQSATLEPATENPVVAVHDPPQTPQVEEPSEAGGGVHFTVDSDLSEARFIIGEILINAPNTVVGVNKQVQGGGVLNFLEPELSTLGEFLIDSSGFETDSSMRNRAIRNFTLQYGQFPLISFQPTEIVGIPSEIIVGESIPFEIIGQLTIREVTQEVTFGGAAIMVDEDRVEGLATATVLRSDFDLSIPSVERVAGVDEEFTLEIEFVAVAG